MPGSIVVMPLFVKYRVPSLNAILKGKIVKNLMAEKRKAADALASSLKAAAPGSAIQTIYSSKPSSMP